MISDSSDGSSSSYSSSESEETGSATESDEDTNRKSGPLKTKQGVKTVVPSWAKANVVGKSNKKRTSQQPAQAKSKVNANKSNKCTPPLPIWSQILVDHNHAVINAKKRLRNSQSSESASSSSSSSSAEEDDEENSEDVGSEELSGQSTEGTDSDLDEYQPEQEEKNIHDGDVYSDNESEGVAEPEWKPKKAAKPKTRRLLIDAALLKDLKEQFNACLAKTNLKNSVKAELRSKYTKLTDMFLEYIKIHGKEVYVVDNPAKEANQELILLPLSSPLPSPAASYTAGSPPASPASHHSTDYRSCDFKLDRHKKDKPIEIPLKRKSTGIERRRKYYIALIRQIEEFTQNKSQQSAKDSNIEELHRPDDWLRMVPSVGQNVSSQQLSNNRLMFPTRRPTDAEFKDILTFFRTWIRRMDLKILLGKITEKYGHLFYTHSKEWMSEFFKNVLDYYLFRIYTKNPSHKDEENCQNQTQGQDQEQQNQGVDKNPQNPNFVNEPNQNPDIMPENEDPDWRHEAKDSDYDPANEDPDPETGKKKQKKPAGPRTGVPTLSTDVTLRLDETVVVNEEWIRKRVAKKVFTTLENWSMVDDWIRDVPSTIFDTEKLIDTGKRYFKPLLHMYFTKVDSVVNDIHVEGPNQDVNCCWLTDKIKLDLCRFIVRMHPYYSRTWIYIQCQAKYPSLTRNVFEQLICGLEGRRDDGSNLQVARLNQNETAGNVDTNDISSSRLEINKRGRKFCITYAKTRPALNYWIRSKMVTVPQRDPATGRLTKGGLKFAVESLRGYSSVKEFSALPEPVRQDLRMFVARYEKMYTVTWIVDQIKRKYSLSKFFLCQNFFDDMRAEFFKDAFPTDSEVVQEWIKTDYTIQRYTKNFIPAISPMNCSKMHDTYRFYEEYAHEYTASQIFEGAVREKYGQEISFEDFQRIIFIGGFTTQFLSSRKKLPPYLLNALTADELPQQELKRNRTREELEAQRKHEWEMRKKVVRDMWDNITAKAPNLLVLDPVEAIKKSFIKLSDEQKERIITLLRDQKTTANHISRSFKISKEQVCRLAAKNNIKLYNPKALRALKLAKEGKPYVPFYDKEEAEKKYMQRRRRDERKRQGNWMPYSRSYSDTNQVEAKIADRLEKHRKRGKKKKTDDDQADEEINMQTQIPGGKRMQDDEETQEDEPDPEPVVPAKRGRKTAATARQLLEAELQEAVNALQYDNYNQSQTADHQQHHNSTTQQQQQYQNLHQNFQNAQNVMQQASSYWTLQQVTPQQQHRSHRLLRQPLQQHQQPAAPLHAGQSAAQVVNAALNLQNLSSAASAYQPQFMPPYQFNTTTNSSAMQYFNYNPNQ